MLRTWLKKDPDRNMTIDQTKAVQSGPKAFSVQSGLDFWWAEKINPVRNSLQDTSDQTNYTLTAKWFDPASLWHTKFYKQQPNTSMVVACDLMHFHWINSQIHRCINWQFDIKSILVNSQILKLKYTTNPFLCFKLVN